MRKIHLLFAMLAVLFLPAFKADHVITIYMIGDSTMANKSLEAGNQERGWGHMLGGFFTENVRVENHALNGRSSKSFIDEGHWDEVVKKIQPGDYVFIQFGHNDEKPQPDRHTEPGTTFDENLRKFVRETRGKGGIPVLFNSVVRRNFGENPNAVSSDDFRPEKADPVEEGDTLVDTHGKYLDSPRNVAKEMDVCFIDLNKATKELVESMGIEGSKKLFMWIREGTSPACPKGRQDNTHFNVYGGRKVARLAAEAIERQIPQLAKYVRYYDFVVAKDGSGDFFTVQEAINAVPDFRKSNRTTILVRQGEYKERVIIPASKINVSLIGEDGAVITNDNYASRKNIFGEEMSTSGSSTVYIYAPDFYAENITFANTAGRVGQAVACFVDGDRAYFKQCRFLGNQDTLYTYGKESRQYYEACYIEGTVDFIFGWSTAVFKDCEIRSLGNGYVTAPATDKGKAYGYVFWHCSLTAEDEATEVYLSRPWRPYAQAVYIECRMGGHILPAGWDNWRNPENEKTVFYAEYKSTGEGANPTARTAYSHQLVDIVKYNPETVLAGDDGWNPIKNGNSLLTNLKR